MPSTIATHASALRAALFALLPTFAACSDAPTSASAAHGAREAQASLAVRDCTRCDNPIVFDAGTDPLVAIRSIYRVNPDGSGFTQLTSGQHSDREPSWSPDYRRIVFTSDRHGGPHNVYSMNSKGQNLKRLTNVNLPEQSPVISPDGKKIVYVRQWLDGKTGIMFMDVDGSNEAAYPLSGFNREPTWSPDSKKILFTSDMYSTSGNYLDRDIYVINLDGTGLTRLTTDAAYDANPVWSPDGSKIFFESDRGGQYGIYKMNPNGSNVELVHLAPAGSYIGYISLNAAGTKMLYYSDEAGQQFRISGLNGGPSTVLPLPRALASLGSAAWSFAR